MAFILEKISEEDKERYGINPKYTSQWAIDRDNNSFLLYCGGVPTFNERNDMVQFYELYLDGNVSYITTYIKQHTVQPRTKGSLKYDIVFDINLLQIPQTLKDELEKIKNFISYGLNTGGGYISEQYIGSVTVNFPQQQKLGGGIYFIDPATFQKRKY